MISRTKEIFDMRSTTGLMAVTALTAALTGVGITSAADVDAKRADAVTTSPADVAATATKPTEVIVKVNGVAITRAELDRAIQAFQAQNRMPAPTDPDLKKKIEDAAQDQLISAALLYQVASKETIPDLDDQVEAKFDELKSRFPASGDMDKALAQKGITVQEMKDLLRHDIVISSYIEKQIASKIAITAEQAKKFYDENLDKLKKPESVHASHILIGIDPKATAEEKQKAQQKADELLKQVKGGADFAELAKKESTCPSSKNGGDLGEFNRGQMVKPFEDVAFGLKPGEVSGVVETQFGYHIIKSTGKSDGGVIPFDEVKGKIEKYLKEMEVRKQVLAEVEDLKKTAKIESPGPQN
jgi:peptidyl-prolyl cis-trans isomerase C